MVAINIFFLFLRYHSIYQCFLSNIINVSVTNLKGLEIAELKEEDMYTMISLNTVIYIYYIWIKQKIVCRNYFRYA